MRHNGRATSREPRWRLCAPAEVREVHLAFVSKGKSSPGKVVLFFCLGFESIFSNRKREEHKSEWVVTLDVLSQIHKALNKNIFCHLAKLRQGKLFDQLKPFG